MTTYCDPYCTCAKCGGSTRTQADVDRTWAKRFGRPAGVLGEIADERRRQIDHKGYTPDHDDEHTCEEIAALAVVLAMPEGCREWDATSTGYGDTLDAAILPAGWRLPAYNVDRRADLIKAAALLVAEIERLDRTKDKG